MEFESPFRELGFNGVPHRSTAFVMPTVNCLVRPSRVQRAPCIGARHWNAVPCTPSLSCSRPEWHKASHGDHDGVQAGRPVTGICCRRKLTSGVPA